MDKLNGLRGRATEGPIVSIGFPVFNGERFLRSALDSLLGQTFGDFELIISDNASTDGTRDICIQYALLDRRIRYLRQSRNLGAWSNFGFVLQQAVGEYFMWAAADDVRSGDCVEFYLNSIGDAGGVFSTYAVRDLDRHVDQTVDVPPLPAGTQVRTKLRSFFASPCPSMIYGLLRRHEALTLFPSIPFDWGDCYFLLRVIYHYDFINVSGEPKYFAGVLGQYEPKPVGKKGLSPMRYFVKALPYAVAAGPGGILSHARFLVSAYRLDRLVRLGQAN